jgi:hypothetical protein
MHCSAFAAVGPATADGKIVFGHITMDGLYSSNFYNVWLDVKPKRGHRVLMCAFPGGIQSGMDYYLNDAGLLMTETTITQTRFDINGASETSRIRQAMQYAANIDEAVAILLKSNNGLYTNEWLLGDINANEIAVLELGTHKHKLRRSSKNEWFGDTPGFYWGCNNTKSLELRLETIPSVSGRPANLVFFPHDRDILWQKLYHKYRGKIGVAFGMEAFTTPPLAAIHSCDAKFTTTDMAKKLQSWCLFGPPLGRTWQPTEEEKRLYPEIKPLVSNPWTVLSGDPPPKAETTTPVAVDLKPEKKQDSGKKERKLLRVPAWHGTLLPQSDGDIWLATAFAEYERIVAREQEMKGEDKKAELKPEDRDRLAVALFGYRSAYLPAMRASADVPLARIHATLTRDEWYRIATGKGVLVLHELRKTLGDDVFLRAMDTFGRENAGKKVSTAQFQAHVEKVAGKKLEAFFDSWLQRAGLPTLKLARVGLRPQKTVDRRNVAADPGEPAVIGEIHQESPFLTQVEVTIEADKGELTRTVMLKGEHTPFEIQVPAKYKQPRRVILDKYASAARMNGGLYSFLSFNPEQEKTLIVYGTAGEAPTNREAAEAAQKGIRDRWSNYTVPMKSDKEVSDADLKAHHLLLIGRPDSNTVVARFRAAFPVTFGRHSFVVRGKTYAHMGSAVVATGENPLNPRYSVTVLAGLCAEATVKIPPALLHRHDTPAEVLVLPYQQSAEALVIPARDLVRELR